MLVLWENPPTNKKALVKDRVNKPSLMLVLQYILYFVIQLRGLLVRVTFKQKNVSKL
jgi:hypothetical protein